MNTANATRGWNLNPLLPSAVVIVATLVAAFFVTQPPRGFGVFLTTVFICWVEALFGMLVYWRRSRALMLSGATSAMLFTTMTSYGVLGFASVVAFVVVRDPNGAQDRIIFGILLIETVAFFLLFRMLVQHDNKGEAIRTGEAQIQVLRVAGAERLMNAISAMKRANGITPDESRRSEALIKRLYGFKTALEHSHGECLVQGAEAQINSCIDALDAAVTRMQPGIPIVGIVPEMERVVNNLESLLRQNRIS